MSELKFFRPSSLPMLEQCAQFAGGDSSQRDETFLSAGTARHSALADLLSKDEARMASIPHFDRESVKWAAEYVHTNADVTFTTPLIIEETREYTFQSLGVLLRGTADIVCGGDIFDLKSRYRDYSAQMAAYALMRLHDEPTLDHVTTHLLFCDGLRVEKSTWTWDEAMEKCLNIIDRSLSDDSGPVVCDYCNWCAKRTTCPAVLGLVKPVADASVADASVWSLVASVKPCDMTPEQVAMALQMRKTVTGWIDVWGDEVRARAFGLIDSGEDVPGWAIQERKGRQDVTDLLTAQIALEIDASSFIAACKVSVSDLVGLYGERNGLNAAAAKRAVQEKLAPVLKCGESTRSLVAKKS